jgi:hypothetical protein
MAEEQGINPAFALAVAQRESDFNPYAHASHSIYGIYQMSGPLRYQYGSGNSADPYTQATAWGRFINQTRSDLQNRIGREPTDTEARDPRAESGRGCTVKGSRAWPQ